MRLFQPGSNSPTRNSFSHPTSNFIVFAALACAIVAAPELTEIPAPKGHEMFIPLAVSTQGEVVFEATGDEGTNLFEWKDGKTIPFKYTDNKGYGLDPDAAQSNGVAGFAPDGSFFGYRVFAFNGASSTWMSRPFVAKDGQIKPLPYPRELKNWNDIEPLAVRPDGAFLIRALEETTNGMMGDPKKWIDQLLWIKNGELLSKVGQASDPILDKKGNIVAATQYVDSDGDVTGEAIYNRRAFLVLYKNGKFERITDGQAIALLDNGDLIFRRHTYTSPDDQYDVPEKVTFHRLRNGQISDFKPPGLPDSPRILFVDGNGSGIMQGWNGETEIFRTFNGTTFQDIPIPAGLNIPDVSCCNNGWFAISGEDKEQNFRIFVGRRP